MSPEQIQQVQQILFVASIVLSVAGIACLAGAAYMYFKLGIRDIQDDLSGKKRAEAIASMDAPGTGVLRRRASHDKSNRAKARLAAVVEPVESSASLELAIDKKPSPARQEVRSSQPAGTGQYQPASRNTGTPIPQIDDDAATSVLEEEVDQTTMFGDEAAPVSAQAEEAGAVEDKQQTIEAVNVQTTESIDEDAFGVGGTAQQTVQVPEYFKVVQRIVLKGSADFVRVKQGEGHE